MYWNRQLYVAEVAPIFGQTRKRVGGLRGKRELVAAKDKRGNQVLSPMVRAEHLNDGKCRV